ncbi:DUF202 domain-containing protein [Microbacterium sp.]|uniref:DUF202 domain-containing protein n=1 Tax=Microbacterium sp. TaxID=51671 RepID=UPI00281180F6|nr:DUF202 domain-containing protein [Microbacterium sp.]
MNGPADAGLQPERTELAWRRTALAIAIGSLLSLRIFPAVLPAEIAAWGFAPGAVGVAAALALWIAGRRRRVRFLDTMTGALPPSGTPGGAALFGLSALCVGFGIVALGVVVGAAAR